VLEQLKDPAEGAPEDDGRSTSFETCSRFRVERNRNKDERTRSFHMEESLTVFKYQSLVGDVISKCKDDLSLGFNSTTHPFLDPVQRQRRNTSGPGKFRLTHEAFLPCFFNCVVNQQILPVRTPNNGRPV
jgi:hypothetical protein